jgi:hypothetical protein
MVSYQGRLGKINVKIDFLMKNASFMKISQKHDVALAIKYEQTSKNKEKHIILL